MNMHNLNSKLPSVINSDQHGIDMSTVGRSHKTDLNAVSTWTLPDSSQLLLDSEFLLYQVAPEKL